MTCPNEWGKILCMTMGMGRGAGWGWGVRIPPRTGDIQCEDIPGHVTGNDKLPNARTAKYGRINKYDALGDNVFS